MVQHEYQQIPNRLRLCRLERGYTQAQVAKVLGMKGTDLISEWENGVRFPSLVSAFKLAGFYKVYVEAFYFDLFDKLRAEVAARAEKVLGSDGAGNTVR